MQNALETLGFEQIRAQLAGCAATKWAQDKIAALAPHRSEARLTGALRETNDARNGGEADSVGRYAGASLLPQRPAQPDGGGKARRARLHLRLRCGQPCRLAARHRVVSRGMCGEDAGAGDQKQRACRVFRQSCPALSRSQR